MRTQITVLAVGESEVLSGGATKLKFTAKNGKQEVGCFTFKTNIASEVSPSAVLDVDVDELHYTDKQGNDILAYKVWGIHRENGETKPSQPGTSSGTWREEKAAEVIGQLLVGKVITKAHPLSKKLLKWLDESLD